MKIKLSNPDNLGLLMDFILFACIKKSPNPSVFFNPTLNLVILFLFVINPTVTNNYDGAECEVMLIPRGEGRGGTLNY